VTLSVITPTRNRSALWRSGWLLDSLRAQTEPPDELVIAIDHTEDDTLAAIRNQLHFKKAPFPVRILEVLSPRPGPDPASAIPDNCLFAAATGDILVHLDDDITIGLDFCRRVRTLLPLGRRAILWHHLFFVRAENATRARDSTPNVNLPVDYRAALAIKHRWPLLTGGIIQLPANRMLHWGGAWSAPRAELLAVGGHDLSLAGYRNADARLGNRLVRAGLTSFTTNEGDIAAVHLGTTRRAVTHTSGPTGGPTIANGGAAYWTSDACRSSYRIIAALDSRNQ